MSSGVSSPISCNPTPTFSEPKKKKERSIPKKTSPDNSCHGVSPTHASLCESMRFYPPVSADTKEAFTDDVLLDGTMVKKGTRVTYHIYAMGRSETLWGSDWAEFKPERWLEKEEGEKHWMFAGRDTYTYPVFQAGPRIFLGKDMAFIQMKRVGAGVVRRFKVVPVLEKGFEPEFLSLLISKMKGGLPVRIVERILRGVEL